MKTRIVRIGNSQGIRIPKPLLEQTGLRGEVEISAEDDTLIIRPARRPREGWAASFREMARRGDDALLDDDAPSLSNWDEDDWAWRDTCSHPTQTDRSVSPSLRERRSPHRADK
jgi:antitoxin MazE